MNNDTWQIPNPQTIIADLNAVDNLNSEGVVEYNSIFPVRNGETLKGALAPYRLPSSVGGSYFHNNHAQQNANAFFQLSNQTWFWVQLENIIASSCELFDYSGLPTEIDKYMLEYLLRNNGVCGLVLKNNLWFVVPVENENNRHDYNSNNQYTTVFNLGYIRQDWTIKNEFFDDVTIEHNKNFFIIRNNLYMTNVWILINRYLNDLENVLQRIENNTLTMAPKALGLNTGQTGEKSLWEKQMNDFLTSSRNFMSLDVNTDSLENITKQRPVAQPFVEVQYNDKTMNLMEVFKFHLERIKELLGVKTLTMGGKKERVLTSEIEASGSMSEMNLMHMLNIRNNDLALFNKVTKHNVKVSRAKWLNDTNQQVQNQLSKGERSLENGPS